MNIYHIAPKRSGHALVGNMIKSWNIKNYHDFENVNPASFGKRDGLIVLQVRDMLNWYASYWKQQKGIRMVKVYLQIAREFFGKTDHLRDHKVFRVYYDHFVSNIDERKKLCHDLGGVYSDNMFSRVTDNGGGSSFSGVEKDGTAQSMNVLTRYMQVPKEIYKELFRDSRTLDFYLEYMATDKTKKFLSECGLM